MEHPRIRKDVAASQKHRATPEIVRAFDLLSVVELRDNLAHLAKLLDALGAGWRVVFSDYLRDAGGNRERSPFLFNSKRVRLKGLASTAEGPRVRGPGTFIHAVVASTILTFGAEPPFAHGLSEIAAHGDWIGARRKIQLPVTFGACDSIAYSEVLRQAKGCSGRDLAVLR